MAATLAYTLAGPEVHHLRAADPTLGEFITRIGPVEQPLESNLYASLANAIVAQQLSDAAASTIWGRLVVALGGDVSPVTLLSASDETLRAAGLSRSKLAFMRDLATRVVTGALKLSSLEHLPDDDVIAELLAVKGIGRWTAEMFLIFSLGRPNVLAVDDGALRTTVGWLYGMEGAATREQVLVLGQQWQPYCTCASLYLWRGLAARREAQRNAR